jgi:hypothetical protein
MDGWMDGGGGVCREVGSLGWGAAPWLCNFLSFALPLGCSMLLSGSYYFTKMHHRSLNFLWCAIPVHELSKRVIAIPNLSSGL